jgi:hypothetical protein
MNSNLGHNSIRQIARRRVTEVEQQWIRQIVLANPVWADTDLGDLFVTGECDCGCRTIVFEEPAFVQNPRVKDHQGVVGTMDISIRIGEKEDVVSLLLHHLSGKLLYLEVVWYNFPTPVPTNWVEIGRVVRAGF